MISKPTQDFLRPCYTRGTRDTCMYVHICISTQRYKFGFYTLFIHISIMRAAKYCKRNADHDLPNLEPRFFSLFFFGYIRYLCFC